MKRILIPLMLFAIAACSLEVDMIESPAELIQQEITITATSGEPDTRTERAADGSVLWSPGDQISLFYGSGADGGSCFTAQNTETAKTVNFTGTIGVITGGNNIAVEDTYFWAVYPYNAAASCDGNSITTVLPAEQVATADTFADDLFPSMGRSQGLNMAFYNICGGLKFTVSEEGIKSVTLRSNAGEHIAGKITAGYDDNGLPVVTKIADGTDYVTLTAPAGESLEVGRAYYLVFVPTVFESGFTLTFSKGYSQAVMNRTAKTTIRRSVFGSMANPDAGLEWEMLYVPIPDENFRSYMIQNFDTNGNGNLDLDEAEAVTSINVCTDNIESLAGVEYCKHLKSLNCRGTCPDLNNPNGILLSLDLSENLELQTLFCSYNRLTSLNISSCTALTRLDCYKNNLSVLDVSQNTSLSQLSCGSNQLTSLDVSANTALTRLECQANKLTSLDVSENAALNQLNCFANQLNSMNVSNNTALTYFSCGGNKLTSLDVSNNTALTYLRCSDNYQLTSLDISANVALEELDCQACKLSSLDVSNNTQLRTLWCGGNNLTSLHLGGIISLTDLLCNGNQLTYLDVSANTALTTLWCGGNQLTSLNVSANTVLTYLECGGDQLTSLDLNSNTALTRLECGSNQLTSLDVSANAALTYLSCGYNKLTSLNVSSNTALQRLECNYNQLTSLDISSNIALTKLICDNNQLTSLDVSANTMLTELSCCNNLISALDVSANGNLSTLKCNNNPYLTEIWLSTEQSLSVFNYDASIANVKYRGAAINMTISTTDEFLAWVTSFNQGAPYYGEWTLEADIDCGGVTITPIQTFSCTLNGKGHSIYNLKVVSDDYIAGLIMNNYGKLKNIVFGSADGMHYDGVSTIIPASGAGGSHVGLVSNNYGLLDNVVNFMTINYLANNNPGNRVGIGGLVGNGFKESIIRNCTNKATINASGILSQDCSIGGVIGLAQGNNIIIDGCVNAANIIVEIPVKKVIMVGGIIGRSNGEVVIRNCENTSLVSYNQVEAPNTYMSLGGICGGAYNGTKVLNCINSGPVLSNLHQASRVSGILGTLNSGGRVDGCVNNGPVSIEQTNPNANWETVSGIVGLQEKDSNDAEGNQRRNVISNNINNGDVTLIVENTTAHQNRLSAAGVIGVGCLDIDVTNNTNRGTISIDNRAEGDAFCGGIMGMAVSTNAILEGNFNDGAVSCRTSDDVKSCAGGIIANAGRWPGKTDVTTVTVTGDKSTGIITCGNAAMTGSIAGLNLGALINCLAGGSVNGVDLSTENLNQLVQGPASTGTVTGPILVQ